MAAEGGFSVYLTAKDNPDVVCISREMAAFEAENQIILENLSGKVFHRKYMNQLAHHCFGTKAKHRMSPDTLFRLR